MADSIETVVTGTPEYVDKVSKKRKKHSRRTIAGDGFADSQFESPPAKIPYKAIFIAIGLFVVGGILIIVGCLFLTGNIQIQHSGHTWPLLLVGILMFIPGAYYIRIAYYAYKGYDGFSYENMPEVD
ncbi:unnamed protein product [Candidula unifasciata]|uniref:Transmembrane protein 230 n=1 Tax=Candidula unifasciata TaxID=100452 RepID=A0A8S3YKQ5_9EUPU|nr:unnamed protein product [Candidula unifasciata]